eukprot:6181522-Pleurochrysis_carterae.AAC.1
MRRIDGQGKRAMLKLRVQHQLGPHSIKKRHFHTDTSSVRRYVPVSPRVFMRFLSSSTISST